MTTEALESLPNAAAGVQKSRWSRLALRSQVGAGLERSPIPYLIALLAVAGSTGVAILLQRSTPAEELLMFHVLATVLVAAVFKPSVSLFTCIVGTAAFDYLLIPPHFEFGSQNTKHGLTFTAVLLVTSVVSILNLRLRHHERMARQAARRAEMLYHLSGQLASSAHSEAQLEIVQATLERNFGRRGVLTLLEKPENLDPPNESVQSKLRERSTLDRSTNERTLWLPILGSHRAFGTLEFRLPISRTDDPSPDPLLAAIAGQLGLSLERLELGVEIRAAALEADSERMKNTLLSGFSHDLKTPLAIILAAATTLMSHAEQLDEATARQLLSTVVTESERMNALIRNILFFSRLNSPGLELQHSTESIEEIITTAVARVSPPIAPEQIQVRIEEHLPLVRVEPILIEQVLVNLLENAWRYSGTTRAVIELVASTSELGVRVGVGDNGPGISPDERDLVVRKFYRGRSAQARDGGMGLGLTICQAAVVSHGGSLHIGTSQLGGAWVEFTLPTGPGLADAPPADIPAADSAQEAS